MIDLAPQPIDTVSKVVGQRILGIDTDHFDEGPATWVELEWDGSGWGACEKHYGVSPGYYTPTHWIPVPPKPIKP